jgi:hypothetical protein
MARTSHGLRIARDLVRFALENKKWWLIPVIVFSVLVLGLVVVASTPLAPFVYTFF